MRVLITGATGLVGRELTAALLQKKHQVNFLTTRASQINAITGAQGFLWDPSQKDIDRQCFEGVDVIIHLAGTSISIPWTSKNRKAILDSRVETTRLLRKAYQEFSGGRCKKFIAASAIGIYPSDPNHLWVEDDSHQVKPDSFLQKVVEQWEGAVSELSTDIPSITHLRIGLVLSNNGGVFPTLKLPTQWGVGAAFGHGNQYQSWIHVDDVARAFVHAVENLNSGIYNAVSPSPVTQNELIRQLGKVLNRPVFLPNIPAFVMRAVLGERSQLVLNSQQVSASRLVNSGFQFNYDSLEEALTDLIKNQ